MYWRYSASPRYGRGKRQSSIRMQVKVGRLRLLRWPVVVGMPGVRSGLEGGHLPRRLVTLAVEIVAEKGRFNVLPELDRGLVTTEGHRADAVSQQAIAHSP